MSCIYEWKEELEDLECELAALFSDPNDMMPDDLEVDRVIHRMYLLNVLIQSEENEP